MELTYEKFQAVSAVLGAVLGDFVHNIRRAVHFHRKSHLEVAMQGRAMTDKEKRAVIERIYRIWTMTPSLRLGQLLSNALAHKGKILDIYYVEDEELAERTENLVKDVMNMRQERKQ